MLMPDENGRLELTRTMTLDKIEFTVTFTVDAKAWFQPRRFQNLDVEIECVEHAGDDLTELFGDYAFDRFAAVIESGIKDDYCRAAA